MKLDNTTVLANHIKLYAVLYHSVKLQ